MRFALRLALLALAGGAFTAHAGLIFNRNAKPSGPDVLIVGDVIPEAMPVEFTPSPDHPVPYVFLGGAERAIGDPVANEPMPDQAVIREEIIKALSPRGYIETKVGGPVPRLVIVFAYGTANYDDFIGDKREMARLVGATKANRHLMMSTEAQQINDAANSDRVYLMIAALDAEALRKKEKKLVWRTRISIESRHQTLPDNLKLMLADASPYFGQDTDRPVFSDDDTRKAQVKLGELKFLDDAPSTTPAKPDEKK